MYNNSFLNQPTKTFLQENKTAANHTNTNTQTGHDHRERNYIYQQHIQAR